MKGHLITTGVLSILIISFWICFFIGAWKDWNFFWLFSILIVGLSITDFVMGIINLSTEKHKATRGLIIASGTLSIINGLLLGFLLFVNAIVSFIGVAKINSSRR